jgi:hypothetical protein
LEVKAIQGGGIPGIAAHNSPNEKTHAGDGEEERDRTDFRREANANSDTRAPATPPESLVGFFQVALGGPRLNLTRKRDKTRTIKW